jgi:hypothetical protein
MTAPAQAPLAAVGRIISAHFLGLLSIAPRVNLAATDCSRRKHYIAYRIVAKHRERAALY